MSEDQHPAALESCWGLCIRGPGDSAVQLGILHWFLVAGTNTYGSPITKSYARPHGLQ